MYMNTLFGALSTVAIVLGTWAVVGFATFSIMNRPPIVVESTSNADTIRLLSYVQNTEQDRTSLRDISAVDVVTAAKAVEQAGRDAGLVLKIGGSTSAPPAGNTKNQPVLDSVFLAIDTQGSFAQVTRLVALLQNLPTPSVLDQFQLSKVDSGDAKKDKGVAWRFSGRIKIFFSSTETL